MRKTQTAIRLGGTPDLPSEGPWPWRSVDPDRAVFKDHLTRQWPLSSSRRSTLPRSFPLTDWKQSRYYVGRFFAPDRYAVGNDRRVRTLRTRLAYNVHHRADGQDLIETHCVKFADDDLERPRGPVGTLKLTPGLVRAHNRERHRNTGLGATLHERIFRCLSRSRRSRWQARYQSLQRSLRGRLPSASKCAW